VTAHIQAELDSWTDLLIFIDVDPFAITGREEYKFTLDSVWLDFSDIRNPVQMTYPGVYDHPHKDHTLWQGVYFKKLSVTLPEYMHSGSNPEIGIRDFIFDNCGVSGELFAGSVLSLGDGSASGWAMSIDSLSLVVLHNRFASGYLGGLIHVPIFKQRGATGENVTSSDCFSYIATADSYGRYLFKVTLNDSLSIPMALATVELDANTSLSVHHSEEGFAISAYLHGSISINSDFGSGINLNMSNIAFQNVVLANHGRRVRSIGYWQFPDVQMDFGGFELNFKKIGIREAPKVEDGLEFYFDSHMNLTMSGVDLKMDFEFGVQGILNDTGNHHRWVYDKVNFYRAAIYGSAPGIDHIYGELIRYIDDATYGSGWRGAVSVRFKDIKADIKALGVFGRKDDYKYGLVDAMVIFGTGVPVLPPLYINGLGGGFWYNMTSQGHESIALKAINPDNIDNESIASTPIGENLSEVTYVPQKGPIGFKIATGNYVANDQAISGTAALSFEFNQDWGLNEIRLDASVYIMALVDIELPPAQDNGQTPNFSPFCGFTKMKMDIKHGVFTANFQSFLDYGVIKGAGDNNAFATVNIRIASAKDWHFWFATPTNRAGLKLGSVPLLDDFTITTYFCIGTNLPAEGPDLPPLLRELFPNRKSFLLDRRYATGAGFMHGSQFEFGLGGKFWIFTLTAQFEAGYDVAVIQYNAHCAHSDQKPGIDGWYASGQIYAGLGVNIGFEFRVFGIKKSGTIVNASAGILMRAQLPNPFWAQGQLALSYNLLGILKGRYRFNLEVGQRCEFIDPEGGGAFQFTFDIIDYVTPYHGTQAVASNEDVVIHFMYPIDQTIEIDGPSGEELTYTFKLRSAVVRRKSTNLTHQTTPIWNEDRSVLTLRPVSMYNGDEVYSVRVLADAYLDGVVVFSDTLETEWGAMVRPDHIPAWDVLSTYPLQGQHFFMRDDPESSLGYIALKAGQFDLFWGYPKNARNIVRLINNDTKDTLAEMPLAYDCKKHRLIYELDVSLLEDSKSYTLQAVQTFKLPDPNDPGEGGGMEPLGAGGGGGEASRHMIPGSASIPGWPPIGPGGGPLGGCAAYEKPSILEDELLFYEFVFGISGYRTMAEKLEDYFNNAQASYEFDSLRLKYSNQDFEGFDAYELSGVGDIPPLVQVQGITQAAWLNDYMFYIRLREGKSNHISLCDGSQLYVSCEFYPEGISDLLSEGVHFADGADTIDFGNGLARLYQQISFVNAIPLIMFHEINEAIDEVNDAMYYICMPPAGEECVCAGDMPAGPPSCYVDYYPSICQCSMSAGSCEQCVREHYFCSLNLQTLWNVLMDNINGPGVKVAVQSETVLAFSYNPKPFFNKMPLQLPVTLSY
jgi:hypothetical protein